MVLQCRRMKEAVTVVAALIFALDVTMQALRRDMVPPTAEKPLRPTVAETSRSAVHSCCRVPSPGLLGFPSKGNRTSRSGHPPAKGTLHPGPDDFIRFYHAELIATMEDLKAEHKSDMDEIKSEMEKIMSGLRRQAGEFKDLKKEVAHQGTIQRLVIWVVMISTMALVIFVWANYDEWTKKLGALVMVWAGEALYEFTGGWFGKKVS